MVYQRKHDYEYRDGWHPSVDANTVGGVIEDIEAKYGSVTSERFLDASRPEASPTHDVFEWDDGIAAEKYRLHQASRTICSVRVIVKGNPISEKPLRAYVNVATQESKRAEYMNVSDALSNAETRLTVLSRAKRELLSFQEKYSSLTELADVFTAIAKVTA